MTSSGPGDYRGGKRKMGIDSHPPPPAHPAKGGHPYPPGPYPGGVYPPPPHHMYGYGIPPPGPVPNGAPGKPIPSAPPPPPHYMGAPPGHPQHIFRGAPPPPGPANVHPPDGYGETGADISPNKSANGGVGDGGTSPTPPQRPQGYYHPGQWAPGPQWGPGGPGAPPHHMYPHHRYPPTPSHGHAPPPSHGQGHPPLHGAPPHAPPHGTMVHSPNQPDKGSRGVLMCEPVNVELDEGLAIMMGSNHGAPTMMGNQSMMEGHHASSQYHDNSSAESMKKKRNRNDKGRGSYRCGKCGVPKKGHICPYQPKLKRRSDEPPAEMKNMATQVEMDEFLVLRRLNLEIQGFPESYLVEPDAMDDKVGAEPHSLPTGAGGGGGGPSDEMPPQHPDNLGTRPLSGPLPPHNSQGSSSVSMAVGPNDPMDAIGHAGNGAPASASTVGT